MEEKLGTIFTRQYRGGASKFVRQPEFFYYVDLLKSVEALLQIDSVFEQVCK